MTTCAVNYETNRYHEQVAKSERAAIRLEAEAMRDVKHDLQCVLDEIDHKEFLRAAFIATRDNQTDDAEVGRIVRGLLAFAESKAIAALVQRGLGRIGL